MTRADAVRLQRALEAMLPPACVVRARDMGLASSEGWLVTVEASLATLDHLEASNERS